MVVSIVVVDTTALCCPCWGDRRGCGMRGHRSELLVFDGLCREASVKRCTESNGGSSGVPMVYRCNGCSGGVRTEVGLERGSSWFEWVFQGLGERLVTASFSYLFVVSNDSVVALSRLIRFEIERESRMWFLWRVSNDCMISG